jgi:hypothetical protein
MKRVEVEFAETGNEIFVVVDGLRIANEAGLARPTQKLGCSLSRIGPFAACGKTASTLLRLSTTVCGFTDGNRRLCTSFRHGAGLGRQLGMVFGRLDRGGGKQVTYTWH